MPFALSERAAVAGYRLIAVEEIGSTNAEALARARDGERGLLWIVARRQNAGRGRHGREWQTLEGNLAASLLIVEDLPLPIAATLGFVAGLAVHEAIRICAPGLEIALKWPNDVLAGEAKLAGILLESEPRGSAVALVVGIGVNVAAAPGMLPYPATSLAARGRHVHREALFAALADAWLDYMRLWDHGRGMARIRTLWLDRAAGLGGPVTVRIGGRSMRGIFETLDESGRMMVRGDDRALVPVSAGEIYFGTRAGSQPAGAH